VSFERLLVRKSEGSGNGGGGERGRRTVGHPNAESPVTVRGRARGVRCGSILVVVLV
jgi:hypothetical protein